jgi:acyl carrier protein
MSESEIFSIVEKILFAYLPKENHQPLSNSSSLSDDIGINSARMVDIVLDLEDKFGIAIPDSDMDRMATVGDVVQLVSSRISANPVAVRECEGAD